MIKNYSANMLKMFQECPLKYYLLYEEKINIPQNNNHAQKGKNIHALINYYFKGFDISRLITKLSEEEEKLWNNFLSFKINPKKIFASEYTFNIKLEEKPPKSTTWLNGRIDAITKENDYYSILDWKTGKIPQEPEKDLQSYIYIIALHSIFKDKNIEIKTPTIKLSYIGLKHKEVYEISASENYIDEAKKNILTIVNNIQKLDDSKSFPRQDFVTNCNKDTNCLFKSFCKSGEIL